MIRNNISKYIDYISRSFHHTNGYYLYTFFVIAFALLYTLFFILPNTELLFGENSYLTGYYPFGRLIQLLNLLDYKPYQGLWRLYLAGLIVCSLLLFRYRSSRYLWFLFYFFWVGIYHKCSQIQSAGTNTYTISLLSLIVISPAFVNTEQFKNQLNNTLSNLGVYAIRFQVMMLYAVASIYKLYGFSWVDGTAFYYVLYNDFYSELHFQKWLIDKSWAIYTISWLSLGFQLSFPLLVWIKKLKPFVLTLGLLFHLMIILVTGIVDFGVIMIFTYSIFISEELAGKIIDKSGLLKKIIKPA
jgi:hypothetical protein